MHHDYKALFFCSLHVSIIIMNENDVNDMKEVLKSKSGTSWEKKMVFDFQYLAKQVRRKVPPPEILYKCMMAMFNSFKDKTDSQTNMKLFSPNNTKKSEHDGSCQTGICQ